MMYEVLQDLLAKALRDSRKRPVRAGLAEQGKSF
jgi:hypothetical protein